MVVGSISRSVCIPWRYAEMEQRTAGDSFSLVLRFRLCVLDVDLQSH